MYLHAIQQQQQQLPKKQKQQNSKRRNGKTANNERQRKILDYLRNLCADVSPLGYFRFMMIMFCALPPPFAPSIPVASSPSSSAAVAVAALRQSDAALLSYVLFSFIFNKRITSLPRCCFLPSLSGHFCCYCCCCKYCCEALLHWYKGIIGLC